MPETKTYSPTKARMKSKLNFRKLPQFTDKQQDLVKLLKSNDTKMCFISGPAGTAKTFTAVYAALELLTPPHSKAGEIIYTRSLVQSSHQSIGALPGELSEKTDPYFQPFYEKLQELLDERSVTNVMQHARTMPINFMRGANFTDNVVIIDEAQNCTFEELTTISTRIGQHSRLWFLGDPAQSDLKNGHRNDFNNFRKLFLGEEHEEMGIHSVSFTADDILRSEICQHVVKTIETFKKG